MPKFPDSQNSKEFDRHNKTSLITHRHIMKMTVLLSSRIALMSTPLP
jgi:hypothetical protein